MSLGEFELIERYFNRPAAPGVRREDVRLGIGDDAAVMLPPPGSELVAAVDTLVEGRHFPRGSDAQSIGHRALAVNLSDFAAMGAVPAWAMIALTLPSADPQWLAAFARGWFALADRHRVALVGGDTTAGPLTISVQLMGYAPAGRVLRRSGGRPGDRLMVTGTLGDAGAGLEDAQKGAHSDLRARFEYPQPRVEFGLAARGLASAAMDISDGLTGDLPKLAAASGVAAHVEVERIPVSESLEQRAPADQVRRWALAAGDDYELLLAVAPANQSSLRSAAGDFGLRLTEIGELRAGSGVTWSLNGAQFSPSLPGFDHFR